MAKTTIIATRDEGTALVILGKPTTIKTVSATRPAIIYKGEPESHASVP